MRKDSIIGRDVDKDKYETQLRETITLTVLVFTHFGFNIYNQVNKLGTESYNNMRLLRWARLGQEWKWAEPYKLHDGIEVFPGQVQCT